MLSSGVGTDSSTVTLTEGGCEYRALRLVVLRLCCSICTILFLRTVFFEEVVLDFFRAFSAVLQVMVDTFLAMFLP